RIAVGVADRYAVGSRWTVRARTLSDRVTLSLVRRAVDASLAGELLVRAVVPTPQPIILEPRMAYVQVQRQHHNQDSKWPSVAAAQQPGMAPDLEPGDVLYKVQPGDNLSHIAQRFYGDQARFSQIVSANLGREQPGGATLR